jgi:hypothetical protein
MQTIYDVDYFIRKFEAIPEHEIGTQSIHNHCAYWHCDNQDYFWGAASSAFTELFKKLDYERWFCVEFVAIRINDGKDERYQQPTPKQRILAALYDIKKMQSKEQGVQECDATKLNSSNEAKSKKEIIRYVSVPETIKEETRELILN